MYYYGIPSGSDELTHYGRLGMKWGQHIFGDDNRWVSNSRGGSTKSERLQKKADKIAVANAREESRQAKARSKASRDIVKSLKSRNAPKSEIRNAKHQARVAKRKASEAKNNYKIAKDRKKNRYNEEDESSNVTKVVNNYNIEIPRNKSLQKAANESIHAVVKQHAADKAAAKKKVNDYYWELEERSNRDKRYAKFVDNREVINKNKIIKIDEFYGNGSYDKAVSKAVKSTLKSQPNGSSGKLYGDSRDGPVGIFNWSKNKGKVSVTYENDGTKAGDEIFNNSYFCDWYFDNKRDRQ